MASAAQDSETSESAPSESSKLIVDTSNEQWFAGLKTAELLKYSSLEVKFSQTEFDRAGPKLCGHRITLRNNFTTITYDLSRLDVCGYAAKEMDAVTLVLASLGKAKKLVMVYAGVQENQHQELVIRRAVEKLAEGFEVEPVYSRDELSLRKLRLE